MKITVTGSFAGQDSLGDECLLKAVVARLKRHRPDGRIEFQINDPSNAFAKSEACASGFEVRRGLQYSMYRFTHVLRRLKVPAVIATAAGERGIDLAARLGAFGAADAFARLKRSDALFVFGGTQFSSQWFGLNAPSYLKSAEIVHESGGAVYFGPQQYGPLVDADCEMLRRALVEVVTDWRTRNPLDIDLLERNGARNVSREVYDEVFSAIRLYPSQVRAEPAHLLFNLRHTTFDEAASLHVESYRRFAALVDTLTEHFNLPAVFFGVSGASFCDDDAAFAAVKHLSRHSDRISSVGRVRDEHQIFELARTARAVISMSFHGCILSGIAGVPFVPVTEGSYYDYKYAGFDKYTGDQGTPLISLSDCDAYGDVNRIVSFVEQFDPDRVFDARQLASDLADSFYRDAIGNRS